MKKTRIFTILSTLFILIVPRILPTNLKPHELWWTRNAEKMFNTFNAWLGDIDSQSRVLARTYIKEKQYATLLDVPCGTCTEYFGFEKDDIPLHYTGLDITTYLVNRAQNRGIETYEGSIEAMPFQNSSFEVVYVRHILEHLEYYERALKEAIRVASKEVFVVFFKNPSSTNADNIDLDTYHNSLLYHNRYNKQKLEAFVKQNPKVASIEWKFVGGIAHDESFLHIYLK